MLLFSKFQGSVLPVFFSSNALLEKGQRRGLKFKPPKEFRSLQDSNNFEFLEFIPKGDDEHNWSEIITSSVFVGKSIKSADFTTIMRENIIQNAADPKVLEENILQKESYEIATLAIAYTNKGRREVVRIKAFLRPLDCSAISVCGCG